ncbi:hypothetical protein, variant [Sphaeroforma arctica JP610]|uniref:Ski2 N-terminal domain-containing protein n=1 Tax=Sphaeroforma arctica JP610 TaxID=667725 RepID=A0A0L0FQL4_9EUKA|nr:hypothetical protein, variant [Sphaeroforma arctica JP610]KNC79004.1 hypothetical protein, variant [Sphaeroforma arctica JP610]|eukprot:XP_014152906.1 hypothetical protein, variant [Sphaeroforma arctica JP610]
MPHAIRVHSYILSYYRSQAYLAEAVRLANENSTSLQRAPAPATQFVRGKASLLPFTPGGMEEVESRKKALDQTIGAEVRASSAVLDFTDVSALQWVPPGFEEGLDLWRDGVETRECERNTHRGDTLDAIINATADMHSSESEADTDTDTESDGDGVEQGTQLDDMDGQNGDTTLTRTDSLERLLDTATPHVPVTKANNSVEEEWAHAIDITHPVQDFYTRVPHMAKTYPFELDTFQKQV